jgi:5,10-methylenetetrahydromethanopterin reductase
MKFDIGILATEPVPAIVRQVQLAESLGYETAWIADTHLVCRELWVTLAACALATSRIKLGPGVTVPHTRHVSVTASALATVREMLGDRLVVGIGTGDSAAGTLGLRMEKMARTATIEEMTASLRRLLAGESVTFEPGTASRIAWLDRPAPVPIYVGASGPRMLAAAGRAGDGVIIYSSTSPPILRAALARVAEGAGARGRTVGDLDVVIWAPMSVARDRALARDHVRGRVASAMRHPLPVELGPDDRAAIEQVRAGYDFFEHATAGSRHRLLVPERFIDLLALAGRPEDVRARVEEIAGVPGIRRIAILPQVPGGSATGREELLRMFADEVMARVA